MIDYEIMKEILAIPDESGVFFKWHSTKELQEAMSAALGDEPRYSEATEHDSNDMGGCMNFRCTSRLTQFFQVIPAKCDGFIRVWPEIDSFYEDDESMGKIREEWARGVKGTTSSETPTRATTAVSDDCGKGCMEHTTCRLQAIADAWMNLLDDEKEYLMERHSYLASLLDALTEDNK